MGSLEQVRRLKNMTSVLQSTKPILLPSCFRWHVRQRKLAGRAPATNLRPQHQLASCICPSRLQPTNHARTFHDDRRRGSVPVRGVIAAGIRPNGQAMRQPAKGFWWQVFGRIQGVASGLVIGVGVELLTFGQELRSNPKLSKGRGPDRCLELFGRVWAGNGLSWRLVACGCGLGKWGIIIIIILIISQSSPSPSPSSSSSFCGSKAA